MISGSGNAFAVGCCKNCETNSTIIGGCCAKACSLCSIGHHDFILSYNNIILGDGSTTLHYNGSTWETDCFNQLSASFGCNANRPALSVFYFISGPCPDGQSQSCATDRSSPFELVVDSLDCASGVFRSLTCLTNSSSCPNLATNGYISFTVTDPNPPNPDPNKLICFCLFVFGCANIPYPGVSVSVSGPGGGATEVTGDDGQACFVFEGDFGDYTITVSASRFKTYSETVNINKNCPVVPWVHLQTADGYTCIACGCLLPVSNTLSFTANCQYGWCGCASQSVSATLTRDISNCAAWSGQTEVFGAPFCDEVDCGKKGPPGCQPYITTLGCPGEICLPNTVNFSCPPSYLFEFNCVNVNGSCADGTCTDCPTIPCLTDQCGFCDFVGPTCYIYICCSYTITEA